MFEISYVAPESLGAAIPINPLPTFEDFCLCYEESVRGQPPTLPKSELSGLCPAIFEDNHRQASKLIKLSILALDMDNDAPQDPSFIDTLPHPYLLIRSPSSTSQSPRWRIYIPLAESVTDYREYAKTYPLIVQKLFPKHHQCFDMKCKDASRFMYIPNASKLSSLEYDIEGDPFQWPASESKSTASEEASYETNPWNKKLCHEWALPTFGLILGEHAPCAPMRPESDSGNHMVHEYGIADFNAPMGTEISRWDYLHSVFQAIKDGEYRGRPVHQYYLDKWEAAGQPLLAAPAIPVPGMVEMGVKGRYHFTKEHSPSEIYIPLDPTPNELDVIIEHVFDPHSPTHLQKDDITFINQDGNRKLRPKAQIKQQHRHVATTKTLLLGHHSKGLTMHRKTHDVYESLHQIKVVDAIFHQSIQDFIDQLPFNEGWLNKYLYFVTDCQKALPWIHMFGEADTGKTFFALLIASLFGGDPVLDHFADRNFQSSVGENPVIFLDEQVPTTESQGKSSLNSCKLLVTDYHMKANKKYEVPLLVEGYHRLLSAQNSEDCTLPLGDQKDLGALCRRIQVAKMTQQHKEFINKFPLRDTANWLDHEFAEHVAWIRKTQKYEAASGVLALPPYETEFLTPNTVHVSEKNRQLLEGLALIMLNRRANAGFICLEEDAFHIRIADTRLQESLRRDNYLANRVSTKYLSGVLKRAFPHLYRSKKSVKNIRCRCHAVPVDDLKRVCEQLDIAFEIKDVVIPEKTVDTCMASVN